MLKRLKPNVENKLNLSQSDDGISVLPFLREIRRVRQVRPLGLTGPRSNRVRGRLRCQKVHFIYDLGQHRGRVVSSDVPLGASGLRAQALFSNTRKNPRNISHLQDPTCIEDRFFKNISKKGSPKIKPALGIELPPPPLAESGMLPSE